MIIQDFMKFKKNIVLGIGEGVVSIMEKVVLSMMKKIINLSRGAYDIISLRGAGR